MRGRVVLTNPLVDLSFFYRLEWWQNAPARHSGCSGIGIAQGRFALQNFRVCDL